MFCLLDSSSASARLIVGLAISSVLYFAYESIRSIVADNGVLIVNYGLFVIVEKLLFGVPLALYFIRIHNIVLSAIMNTVYALHPAYFIPLMAYVALKDSRKYRVLLLSFMLSSIVALLFYAFYPVAPPWIALPLIEREPNLLVEAASAITGTSIDPNPYAAFPSMHVALAVLSALILRDWFGRRVYAWPILMSFATLYTANHYLLDIVGGWVLAYTSYIFSSRVEESICKCR
jgi:membrane-associated phospholipid phosphatase